VQQSTPYSRVSRKPDSREAEAIAGCENCSKASALHMAGYRTLSTELTSRWEFLDLNVLTPGGFQVPDLQRRVPAQPSSPARRAGVPPVLLPGVPSNVLSLRFREHPRGTH
jgi:hypothetical protein